MQSRSETQICNGAIVELGIVEHNGREFAALGSIVDEARGVLVGYPDATGRVLQTWSGEPIVELTVTGHARGFHGTSLTCWAATVNGRRYWGRNAGTHMVLRMRAKT